MPNKPEEIKRHWVKERVAFGRRKDNSKFYNARKWRKVSSAYRELNPLCEQCKRNGEVGPADVCDHIDGLDNLLKTEQDAYDFKNLQSLCHKCHNKKSGRESGKNYGG